jgi:plasmid segregation protein ParM
MKRFVAIDTGKFATKVAVYNEKKDGVLKFSIRTAFCDGDFRDDAVEDSTVIFQCGDGDVYKVGNGARGLGAELTTDKKLDVHKICALTALASISSKKEEDEIYVAVLLPAKSWAKVSEREDFREFILPEGRVTCKIKAKGDSPIYEKTFVIKKKYVFPESMGALFMDETIGNVSPTSVMGVLDIGNLNLNATLWQGKDLVQDKSSTADLGGSILIQEIAQEISTNVTTCDEMIAAIILKTGELPYGMNATKEQEEAILKIVERVKRQHAEKVKRNCHSRNWSLELMNLVAVGGTSKDIEKELKAAFGEKLTVLDNTEYVNVLGALRMMCARELDKIIGLSDV